MELTLNIHFGGNMKKVDDDYEYCGQLSCKTQIWKISEIRWERFEDFANKEKMRTPLCLVWFKDSQEEMKKLNYVFDTNNEDMFELHTVGKVTGEIDVFLQQDFLETGYDGGENESDGGENERDGGYEPEREAYSDDDDVPREDEEGEQSEDEISAKKLPTEIPKRPIKPKKRKTPSTVSSSQPVPHGESTISYHAASSAPEPTTSSTKPIPQVKKPKRGRSLKITKTSPIPRGVGTLLCPYTDRVFEVINNRAYDTNL